MYKIAVCDDEKDQVQMIVKHLEEFIEKYNIKVEIETFISPRMLLKSDHKEFDIIFLDIKMDELSGIELAKKIREINKSSKIVFLTALECFWKQGYEVNASRYMLKPIDNKELNKVVYDLINEINEDRNSKCLIIEDKNSVFRIEISDIYYIEIVNRKSAVHTKKGIVYSKLKLSDFKQMLYIYGFSDSHKSFLVNLNYIEYLNKDKLRLINGQEIMISRRKRKEFMNIFTNFVSMKV